MSDRSDSFERGGCTTGFRASVSLLQAFCLLSVLVCGALWLTGIAATLATDRSIVRVLRDAMLQPGLALFALVLVGVGFAAARLTRHVDHRSLELLRERLYFAAAMVALILVPSALLGWHWAWRQAGGDGPAITLVLEATAQLVVLLLLVRNARDALALARLRSA